MRISRQLSRRIFIAATAGTAALGDPRLFRPARAATATPNSYDQLRDRWSVMLTGGSFDATDRRFAAAVESLDTTVADFLDAVVGDVDRERVFADLSLVDIPDNMWTTYTRLESMAVAYNTPGSRFQGDAGLLADVVNGLKTTHNVAYHAGRAETGNWWFWEIGGPRALVNTCTLVLDHVDTVDLAAYLGAVDHFVPDPYYMILDPAGRTLSTGYNRVVLCQIVAVRGILGGDSPKLERARDGLSDTFPYVTTGDGFYRDGSFLQHTTVAYTGGYGVGLLSGTALVIALLAGSPWEVVDPNRQIVFDSVLQAFAPVIHDNRMMDFVRGRNIARSNETDHEVAHGTVHSILSLAKALDQTDPETVMQWRAACKGWIERDSFDSILETTSVPRIAEVADLMDDDAVEAASEPSGFKVFPGMDRAVHRGSGWAYAIAMASKRIAFYESGNGENETGFHTGAGMTYLYDQDGGQFTDAFWPTVDLYRLPGITVDTKPLPPKAGGEWGAARPQLATWVGGAALRDTYGAVGMDVEGLLSPLRAKKSWFCLDRYVVALGAGITGSNSGHRVETVIENRNLHADGTNALVVDGSSKPAHQGWSAAVPDVRWAHLEDAGGYIFPNGVDLMAVREERTGSWRDVNAGGNPDEITRRYLTLWMDHGSQPLDGSYAYVIVPGASLNRTKELSRDLGMEILSNTSEQQAIKVPRLGATAANFWQPGSVGKITTSSACSVVMEERAGEITVAVADPTQSGVTTRLTPGADAYVRDGQHGDDNYGADTQLMVKKVSVPNSGFSRDSYIRFDLDSLANEADTIESATLYFRAAVKDSGGTEDAVDICVVDDDWDEQTVTWNTKPVLGDKLGTVRLDSSPEWRSIDLTSHVRQHAADRGRMSVGITQDPPAGDGLATFVDSKENAEFSPYLEVTVADRSIMLTIDRAGYTSWTADDAITVETLKPRITFRVSMARADGASRTAVFRR